MHFGKRSVISLIAGGMFLVGFDAEAIPIAAWTFDATPPTTSGPYAADAGSGYASGWHSSSLLTAYTNPVGNGSSDSFSSNMWAVGDYWQFWASTVGYKGISLSWDQVSSNTGPRDFILAYSADGASFNNFVSYSLLNGSWSSTTYQDPYRFTFDLSAIGMLDNQDFAYFRLIDASTISANGGSVASAGTDRIDNFTISASPVPEPDTLAMVLAGLALAGGMASRRKPKQAS